MPIGSLKNSLDSFAQRKIIFGMIRQVFGIKLGVTERFLCGFSGILKLQLVNC
jgi:hypothetical protein